MLNPEKLAERLAEEGYYKVAEVEGDFRTFELWGNADLRKPNKIRVLFHKGQPNSYAKVYVDVTNQYLEEQ